MHYATVFVVYTTCRIVQLAGGTPEKFIEFIIPCFPNGWAAGWRQKLGGPNETPAQWVMNGLGSVDPGQRAAVAGATRNGVGFLPASNTVFEGRLCLENRTTSGVH